MFVRSAIATILLGSCVFAQQATSAKGARALYYFGRAEKDTLPSVTKTSASTGRRPASTAARPQRTKTAPPATEAQAPAGAAHLGLRYNLVLVNTSTRTATAVDVDRNFKKGECFAIDFEANRSGYLYVLAHQSSGNWTPLFPSPEMVGESNVINPGQKVRVPSKYCFEITDPPGTEKLFVVLSRDPKDLESLHEGIAPARKQDAPPAEPAKPEGTALLLAHSRRINTDVTRLSQQTLDRDLKIVKVAEPESPQEPAHAVYVVSASEKPQSRVVTEIHVKHR